MLKFNYISNKELLFSRMIERGFSLNLFSTNPEIIFMFNSTAIINFEIR